MKTFLRITFAACALAAADVDLAQEPAAAPEAPVQAAVPAQPPAPVVPSQERRPRYGFGVSTGLVPGTNGRLDTQGLGISFVLLRGRLRIEPEVGVHLSRMDPEGLPVSGWDSFSLGGGLLYELARVEKSAVYAGGRLGLAFARSTYGDSSSWSTGEALNAVLGGEYFPAPFVSIGLEAQVGVSAAQPDGGPDTYEAGTGALLILRFYVP